MEYLLHLASIRCFKNRDFSTTRIIPYELQYVCSITKSHKIDIDD